MQNDVGGIRSEWGDMSPFVVHFTKDSTHGAAAVNSMSILSQGCIEAVGKFGVLKNHKCSAKCVCFSEVPLREIKRLVDRRSHYGIGFKKDFIVGLGGGPIMYAYKDTPHAQAIQNLAKQASSDCANPIWQLLPFIDSPGDYDGRRYFFEWEREWRVIGDVNFKPSSLAFLILPEEIHSAARLFFDDAAADKSGPVYRCPIIDPYWGDDRIQQELHAT